jgi:hypothetical protein
MNKHKTWHQHNPVFNAGKRPKTIKKPNIIYKGDILPGASLGTQGD